MSVRRLAEDSVQPEAFAFNRGFTAQAKVWVKKYPKERKQSAVIPLLMLAQEQEGWVTKASIEHIADMLGMPYIRALEVATFYTQFQLKPVGTHAHIQVCGTTPCMLRGSEELIALCKAKIHPEPLKTNAAGTMSWEEVECQGACVNAPMVMIFKDAYENLTTERLEEIIDAFEAGKGGTIAPGPQIDRIFAAPVTGQVTLLADPKVQKGKAAKAKSAGAKSASKSAGPSATQIGKPETGAENALGTSRPIAKGDPKADKEAAKTKVTAAKPAKPAAKPSVTTASKAVAKSEAKSVSSKTAAKPAALMGAAKPIAKAKPAPKAAAKPAAKAAAKPAAKSAPAAATSLDDKNRPATMKKPAKPDDLKLISGVGPKLEGTLNSLGIFTFAQVASWKKAEREWVDGYLKFKGRIDRDDWIKQAKALAKGGRDEYVRVFGKEPR